MGKKSSQASARTTRQEKKQQIHSLIKILRPKVYITDSSNFKNLVQELTGNGNSPASSPPPSSVSAGSPPTGLPFVDMQDHAYQESSLDLSLDSSCFSTPLGGSPDLRVPDSFNHGMEASVGSQNFDFSSQHMDLESLLMGMDSVSNNYDSCYGMIQQEVCFYDYDLSTLI